MWVNQESFTRPIKQICSTCFQFGPDLCEEIQNSHGKQSLSSARPPGYYCQMKTCPKRGHLQACVPQPGRCREHGCFPERSPCWDRLTPQHSEVSATSSPHRSDTEHLDRRERPGQSYPGHPAPCCSGTLVWIFLPLPGPALLQRPRAAIVQPRQGPGETPPARPAEGKDCFIYEVGGKNKAPMLFFIQDEEEEESSPIFGS